MLLFKFISQFLGNRSKQIKPGATSQCQICDSMAPFLDTVDFNKSCEEFRGKFLPPSDVPIDYYLCDKCAFCFAPEFYSWSKENFSEKIYNADYKTVDPDYELVRPKGNAEMIEQLFGAHKHQLRHLDYGGGLGKLSCLLSEGGWNSQSFDPFVDSHVSPEDLGKFDLVTAFEVFEHVPDIPSLMTKLNMLCKPDGILLFSTLISDGNIASGERLTWWYASPRNGHISLFSSASLKLCMAKAGFQLGSFTDNLHLAFRKVPEWARHAIHIA